MVVTNDPNPCVWVLRTNKGWFKSVSHFIRLSKRFAEQGVALINQTSYRALYGSDNTLEEEQVMKDKALSPEMQERALKAFIEVRNSGKCNMLDCNLVITEMAANGYYDIVEWLTDYEWKKVNTLKYSTLINAVCSYLKDNQ